MQSVAAPVLRTPSRCRQTRQGGRHRGYTKAARGGLERGYSPPTLRANNAGANREKHLIDYSLSSEGSSTNESGAAAGIGGESSAPVPPMSPEEHLARRNLLR